MRKPTNWFETDEKFPNSRIIKGNTQQRSNGVRTTDSEYGVRSLWTVNCKTGCSLVYKWLPILLVMMRRCSLFFCTTWWIFNRHPALYTSQDAAIVADMVLILNSDLQQSKIVCDFVSCLPRLPRTRADFSYAFVAKSQGKRRKYAGYG